MEWRVKVVGPAAGVCVSILAGAVDVRSNKIIVVSADTTAPDLVVLAYTDADVTDFRLNKTIAHLCPATRLLLMHLRPVGNPEVSGKVYRALCKWISAYSYGMMDVVVCHNQKSARAQLVEFISC